MALKCVALGTSWKQDTLAPGTSCTHELITMWVGGKRYGEQREALQLIVEYVVGRRNVTRDT